MTSFDIMMFVRVKIILLKGENAVNIFNDKIDVIKKVILLADERNKAAKTNRPKEIKNIGASINSPEYILVKEKRADLLEYVNSLDFETVKMLQTIMYLGRDREYDTNDSVEKRYETLRNHFNESGWNTKDIEVNQMISKAPLGDYLRIGCQILDIKI
nr:DUF3775 domain-containing protein [Bacillus pseudomycoides]